MLYHKSRRESEFVYHKSVPIDEDERSWFFLKVEEKVLKLADIIRSDIEQMDVPFSRWPPLPEEVDYHHVKLLKLLKLLMNSLLSKSFPVAERVERLPYSLGQDTYNMSNRKTKTIKHVQLGITAKRKTRSRLMLDSLNRLGHSISYDEVNNVETSFAEVNVKNQSNRSFVPNNVQPSLFVTFVYDNYIKSRNFRTEIFRTKYFRTKKFRTNFHLISDKILRHFRQT